SKLATPYIFYETSINWVQAPTKGLNSSLYSAITTKNSFGQINKIQFNALSNWNTITGIDGNEIAFMPIVFTSTTQLNKKFMDINDAKELIDDLFNIMNFKSNSSNCIFENVAQHMYNSWDCKQDVACTKNMGAKTTVKFVRAILETAFTIYPLENKLNINN
ncbi:25587_t:CDS:2, partial [Gigaspora margarita]